VSKNVIQCPKCKRELHENNAEFKQIDESANVNMFDVVCKFCNHAWRAHHRDFYPADARKRNPFIPLKIV